MKLFQALFKKEDIIITELSILQQISKKTSFEECNKIDLFNRLRNAVKKAWTSGLGASAIQIGIDLSAFYYELNDKIVELVNPTIIEQQNKYIAKAEGCLSFPNQRIDTYRYKSIIIQADARITYKDEASLYLNHKFSADDIEAQILQHECQHLLGETIFDHRAIIIPIKKEFRKIGRNEICPLCSSGKKYKNCCIDIHEAQQNTRILESKE